MQTNTTAHTCTHNKQDLILVRLLQCIQDSGLLPQELAQQQTHIISADAAAKVCTSSITLVCYGHAFCLDCGRTR